MPARIHLVRHGVSTHVHDGSWVDAERAQRFVELYDAAGIRDEAPPAAVIDAAKRADVLAASDLRRAIESVERLAPDRPADLTPLLREIDFDSPGWMPIRLPVDVWDVLGHAVLTVPIMRRRRTPALARAEEAAEWLISRVPKDATLLAVTHGGFRRFLGATLADRGWRAESSLRTYHNWSVWTFRAP